MIWSNINDLAKFLAQLKSYGDKVVSTSGGFDPLHVGHLRCILESRHFGDHLVVIVNGDGFLHRKKSYVFMPLAERMEIIAGLRGVDHVVPWDDGSQFVAGALTILRPHVFTKGGDRSSPDFMASVELQTCDAIGCRIEYGVGGKEKIQSSSSLVRLFREKG